MTRSSQEAEQNGLEMRAHLSRFGCKSAVFDDKYGVRLMPCELAEVDVLRELHCESCSPTTVELGVTGLVSRRISVRWIYLSIRSVAAPIVDRLSAPTVPSSSCRARASYPIPRTRA